MTVEANELEAFVARNICTINNTLTNLGRFFTPANANSAAVARVLSIARGATTYGLVLCAVVRGLAVAGGASTFSADPEFAFTLVNAATQELSAVRFECPR